MDKRYIIQTVRSGFLVVFFVVLGYAQPALTTIGDITVNAVSHSSVNIQFRNNQPSWVGLKYGLSHGNYIYASANYQSYANGDDNNRVDASISLGGLAPGTTYYLLPTARPNRDDDSGLCATPLCGAVEQVFTTLPLPPIHPAPPAPPVSWVPTEPDTRSYTVISMKNSDSGECVAAAAIPMQPGWKASVSAGDNITAVLGKILYGTVIEFPQGATCKVFQTQSFFHTGYNLPALPIDPAAAGDIDSPNHRWIVFRTKSVAPTDFPPSTVRTGPQWAAKLAKLVVQTPGNPTDGSMPAQNFTAQLFDCYRQGCHHFWFENMEWTHLADATVYPPGVVDPPAFGPYFRAMAHAPDITTPATTPDYIVLDRIYAHGQPWPSRELALFCPGGNHWAIMNSWAQADMWIEGVFPVDNPSMSGAVIGIPKASYQFNAFDKNPIGMTAAATASFTAPPSYSGVFYAWIDSGGLTVDYQSAPGVSLQCAGCTGKSEPSPARTSVPTTSMYYFNGHFSNGAAIMDQSEPWNTQPTSLSSFRPMGIYDFAGNFAYVDNNFMLAIGQTVYNDTDGMHNDAVWTHNYFYFPRSKMQNSGVWDGYGYTFRNDFEPKQALRWRLEGNIFDGSAAHQNPGHAVLIAGGYAGPFSNGTQDILVRNNVFRHLSAGLQCVGGGSASPPDSPTAERIEVFNNLWLDLNRDLYNNGGGGLFSGPFSSYPGCEDLNIHQNTVDLTLGVGPALFLMGAAAGGASVMGEGLNFTENELHLSLNAMDAFTSICGQIVASHPANPAPLCSGGSTGTSYRQMLDSSFMHAGAKITGSWNLTNNVIIGGLTTRGRSTWTDIDQATLNGIAANFPKGNIFPKGPTMAARRAAVNWDPVTYRIVPSAWNPGNIGADVDAIVSATGTVAKIIVSPSPKSVTFTYTAPDSRVCYVDVFRQGRVAVSRTQDGGGATARALTVPSLMPGSEHSYRLMCYFDQAAEYEFLPDQITSGRFVTPVVR